MHTVLKFKRSFWFWIESRLFCDVYIHIFGYQSFTNVLLHRELSWVKIYNVDQRYEANKIEGDRFSFNLLSSFAIVHVVCESYM